MLAAKFTITSFGNTDVQSVEGVLCAFVPRLLFLCLFVCVHALSHASLLKLWGSVFKRAFEELNSEPIRTQTHREEIQHVIDNILTDIPLFKMSIRNISLQRSSDQAVTALPPYTKRIKCKKKKNVSKN